jgi:alpha-tubulin suppressor-like RCC1 family protein
MSETTTTSIPIIPPPTCQNFIVGYVFTDMLDSSFDWSIGIINSQIKIFGNASNSFNDLNNSLPNISTTLQQVPPLLNLNKPKKVFAGRYTAYGIDCQNNAYAWGNNNFGQINLPITSNIKKIVGNDYAGLALKLDGSCVGWGTHSWTGWNNSSSNFANKLNNIRDIDAGTDHFVALNNLGNVITWGINNTNDGNTILSLPNSTVLLNESPFAISSGTSFFTKVSAGQKFNIGLDLDDKSVIWGSGLNNQNLHRIGHNPFEEYLNIDAGYYHILATTKSFNIKTWGVQPGNSNYFGQTLLPNNNIGVPNGVFAIAAGAFHNVIYRSNLF